MNPEIETALLLAEEALKRIREDVLRYGKVLGRSQMKGDEALQWINHAMAEHGCRDHSWERNEIRST